MKRHKIWSQSNVNGWKNPPTCCTLNNTPVIMRPSRPAEFYTLREGGSDTPEVDKHTHTHTHWAGGGARKEHFGGPPPALSTVSTSTNNGHLICNRCMDIFFLGNHWSAGAEREQKGMAACVWWHFEEKKWDEKVFVGGYGRLVEPLKGIEAKEVRNKGRQGSKFSAQLIIDCALLPTPFHFTVLILNGAEIRRLLWLWVIMHHLFN